jgi:hypothetical protein
MRLWLKVLALSLVLLVSMGLGSDAARAGDKSLGKALLLSLAVPGAGEAYLGAPGRARAFLVSEAAIWSSFVCFRVQGSMREDAYQDKARLFAGVRGVKDDTYYRVLSYYLSSEEYNVDILREARLRYPDDRQQQLEYFEANAYFGEDGWEWDTLQRMDEFTHERTMSRQSYRRAVLTTGFAVLNRMVSMIDVYLSFKLEDTGGRGSRLGLGAQPTSYQGFRLYISASF